MSIETIKVPDLGGADTVEVIEVCVAVGDVVSVEDSLVVLESDKASMEVPSPAAGTISAIAVNEGDSISEGAVLVEIETGAADAQSKTEAGATKAGPDDGDEPAGKEDKAAPQSPPESVDAVIDASPGAASKAGGGAKTSLSMVTVPDLGGPEEVTVIEVCVGEGDDVAEGDSLVVLESDKASMEVPSPAAGKVVSVVVKEGQQAAPGADLLQLEVMSSEEPAAAEESPVAQKAKAPAAVEAEAASSDSREIPTPSFAKAEPDRKHAAVQDKTSTGSGIYAGPAVRKLAREMGIALESVNGTGPRKRITKDDLKAFVKTALTAAPAAPAGGSGIPPVPAVDFSKFGDVRIEPMSKIQRVTVESMHRSWLNVPHVTQFDEVDVTDLEEFRNSLKAEAEQRGVKVTPVAFLLKACANALLQHPRFNASLHSDGESIVYKQYVHIGLAVDTPQGLVVPVIRDVDKKSVWQLAAESAELAQKAKDRKLTPNEMQGGCFTISSLGSIGGQGFTPIVNTPEVAILAVSRLAVKPVWNGSEFLPRKMLPLSLSYDHRAVNGADCGRFFTYLNALLSDVRRLAL